MVTKRPTKEEFLEALRQQGINNLEDFLDAILPETGGYGHNMGTEGFGEHINLPEIPMPWGTFTFARIPKA